jgi:hypothetical protein
VWEAAKLSNGGLESALKLPDLRLSKLVAMADAMRVSRLRFLKLVIEETERAGLLSPRRRCQRPDRRAPR